MVGDGGDTSDSQEYQGGAARRWVILAVLCMSMVIVSLSNTSLNVALPTLGQALHATPSDLQWMVAAYSMVFAGLLLPAGAMGDRFGATRALNIGLVIFGAASAFAAGSHSVAAVVAARALMGVGAALVMPGTLSILARVFPPGDRSQAIAIWAGLSGVGGAIGSVLTGFLLQHFWWGSVFIANVVAIGVALIAGPFLIPSTRPVATHRAGLDLSAPVLSSVGVGALVYSAIAAPRVGWLSGQTAVSVLVGMALLSAFVVRELYASHPMFDVRYLLDPGFSAAATTITLIFFTMYGTVFLITQYLQLVNGFSPLQAGLRLLPLPLTFLVAAPLSARAVYHWRQRRVVCGGLLLLATGALLLSRISSRPDELLLGMALAIMAAGMGMTTAPSTTAIIDRVPARHAGSGSAVNDTTRELGGALGVAVLGSVVATVFAHEAPRVAGQPATSLAAALHAASSLASPAAGVQSREAYVHALGVTFVGAAVLLVVAAIGIGLLLGRLEPPESREREGEWPMETSVRGTVETLLAVAGIRPSEDELDELARSYPSFRQALEELHAVPEARYAAPALTFQAAATFADWENVPPTAAGLLASSEQSPQP
jgi:EmrB/QacA subfamily drug resistance transporter